MSGSSSSSSHSSYSDKDRPFSSSAYSSPFLNPAPANHAPPPFPHSPTLGSRTSAKELSHTLDRFQGVIIKPTDLPSSASLFASLLPLSLKKWASENKRGVWLQIPLTHSSLIPIAAENGFTYHHAKERYAMMILWLPQWTYEMKLGLGHHHKNSDGMEESMIAPPSPPAGGRSLLTNHNKPNPPSSPSNPILALTSTPSHSTSFPTLAAPPSPSLHPYEPSVLPHYHSSSLGCGGIVLTPNGDLVTIIEKYSPIADFWKLPGGAIDTGEDITSAVLREIKEETGIDCTFVSIIGFRHLLQYRFGGGDIYFICVCLATSPLQPLIPQPQEIERAKWMPAEEFLALPSVAWFASIIAKPLADEMERLLPAWKGGAKMRNIAQANVNNTALATPTPSSTPIGLTIAKVQSPVTKQISQFYVVPSHSTISSNNFSENTSSSGSKL